MQCSAVQFSNLNGEVSIWPEDSLHQHLDTAGYTALHCTTMYCTALHPNATKCTILHCFALHCTALQCTAMFCTSLQRTLLHPHNPKSLTSGKLQSRQSQEILRASEVKKIRELETSNEQKQESRFFKAVIYDIRQFCCIRDCVGGRVAERADMARNR